MISFKHIAQPILPGNEQSVRTGGCSNQRQDGSNARECLKRFQLYLPFSFVSQQ